METWLSGTGDWKAPSHFLVKPSTSSEVATRTIDVFYLMTMPLKLLHEERTGTSLIMTKGAENDEVGTVWEGTSDADTCENGEGNDWNFFNLSLCLSLEVSKERPEVNFIIETGSLHFHWPFHKAPKSAVCLSKWRWVGFLVIVRFFDLGW